MGMLQGGLGLRAWRGDWVSLPCPLARADLVAGPGTAVDDAAHQLWHAGRVLPCDREAMALCCWRGNALLLSGDTDCISLADGEGWIRTARVGVYPQDLAVAGDVAWVCGGADGRIHRLSLPELGETAFFPVPGMPERIAVWADAAWVLSLITQGDTVSTLLLRVDTSTGAVQPIARLPGLPGAIAANELGIWAAAGEGLYHFAAGTEQADASIDGFGLIRHLAVRGNEVLATDPLAGLIAQVTGETVHVLARGDVGQAIFT